MRWTLTRFDSGRVCPPDAPFLNEECLYSVFLISDLGSWEMIWDLVLFSLRFHQSFSSHLIYLPILLMTTGILSTTYRNDPVFCSQINLLCRSFKQVWVMTCETRPHTLQHTMVHVLKEILKHTRPVKNPSEFLFLHTHRSRRVMMDVCDSLFCQKKNRPYSRRVERLSADDTVYIVWTDIHFFCHSLTRRRIHVTCSRREYKRVATTIVTTVRCETQYIMEWLMYHRSLGVDRLHLLLNDDCPLSLSMMLFSCVSEGWLRISHFPVVGKQQEMIHSWRREWADTTEWFLSLDVDEFVVLRQHESITAFLQHFPEHISCIAMNWMMYGHMNYPFRPVGQCVHLYTHRSQILDHHTKLWVKVSPDEKYRDVSCVGQIQHHIRKDHLNTTCSVDGVEPFCMPITKRERERWYENTDQHRTSTRLAMAYIVHYSIKSVFDSRFRVIRSVQHDFRNQIMYTRTTPQSFDDRNAVVDTTLTSCSLIHPKIQWPMTKTTPCPPIVICLHVGAISPDGLTIFQEQVQLLRNTGLYDLAIDVCVGIVGDHFTPEWISHPKLSVMYHDKDHTCYEMLTLNHLKKRLCHFHLSDAFVLYIHTKGVRSRHLHNTKAVDQWRRVMEYWLVTRFRRCLRLMMEHNLDTLGGNVVNLCPDKSRKHIFQVNPDHCFHYSGNFWWARASHLLQLPDLETYRQHEYDDHDLYRLRAENWILSRYPHTRSGECFRYKELHPYNKVLHLHGDLVSQEYFRII